MWALPSSLLIILAEPSREDHKAFTINRFCKAVVASGFQAPSLHLIIHGGKSHDGLQDTQVAKPPGRLKTINQGNVHLHQNQVNDQGPWGTVRKAV